MTKSYEFFMFIICYDCNILDQSDFPVGGLYSFAFKQRIIYWIYSLSLHAFPGNQTHDLGVASSVQLFALEESK